MKQWCSVFYKLQTDTSHALSSQETRREKEWDCTCELRYYTTLKCHEWLLRSRKFLIGCRRFKIRQRFGSGLAGTIQSGMQVRPTKTILSFVMLDPNWFIGHIKYHFNRCFMLNKLVCLKQTWITVNCGHYKWMLQAIQLVWCHLFIKIIQLKSHHCAVESAKTLCFVGSLCVTLVCIISYLSGSSVYTLIQLVQDFIL